jgi:thioesterase domain-containing protein
MIEEFLDELNVKGVQITLENSNIKYYGPESVLTEAVLSEFRKNKDSIVSYLQTVKDGHKKNDLKSSTESLDNFNYFIAELYKFGYRFFIENANLIFYNIHNKHNATLENKIKQNYTKLFNYYWPLPNTNLTPIQPQGTSEPFFIVHGEQSTPIMSNVFGSEIPLFDFFHQSEDGTRMKYRRIEKIARFYLDQLLKIKPEGPYNLGGYSFGGLLVYEMAQQLKRMGHTINILILIDTSVPNYKSWNKPTPKFHFYSVLRRFRYYIQEPFLIWYKKNIYCKHFFVLGKIVPPALRQFYITRNYFSNSKKYKPQPYDGDLFLITAADQIQYTNVDPYLGWEKFINGKITVTSIPGNHFQIIKNPENSRVLSNTIKDILQGKK